MNFMKRLILSASLLMVLQLGCGGDGVSESGAQAARATNVILFLADGTGLPTVHAASVLAYGKPQALYVHSMPFIGLSETSTASNWVTDSAAGMTAIVTGEKTQGGVVSQSADAERGVRDGQPLKTILEFAEERGLSTGVVSNSPISDATPAACYAHSNSRSKHGEIFSQILQPRFGDGVDVVIGRGRDRIFEQTARLGLNIVSELETRGYRYLDQPATLHDVDPKAGRLVALYETPEVHELDLDQAVDCALRIVSRNPEGFFLMVESDNHVKDIRQSVENMAEFDRIIRRTAEKLRGTDTLIIFTADHSYDLHFPKGTPIGQDIVPAMKADGHHNAEEVLVTAEGPGADKVHGFFPNTRLFHIMMAAYGWE
jgi:alkaline phosphatase